jgi:hypothetical protein
MKTINIEKVARRIQSDKRATLTRRNIKRINDKSKIRRLSIHL